MAEDKTPTVTARTRKSTRHTRLRLETSKALRALGAYKKAQKDQNQAKQAQAAPGDASKPTEALQQHPATAISTRAPRVKTALLASAPVPKAKFRKRQVNKTWLPTHMFHAKRARMSPPSDPLWRFAMPMTPTAKCYRPTHRAANERGAVAWDVSYISTIGLEGSQKSIEAALKAVGIGSRVGSESLWLEKGKKWRNGTRVWEGLVFEREKPHTAIAPVTVIWSALPTQCQAHSGGEAANRRRKIFMRVHPSAFPQLWEEMTRLSKIAKPQISIEDLRYQIGSIEVIGPASTEALLGALWPFPSATDGSDHLKDSVESTWQALAGLTNPAGLPAGALLAFDVQDPRLHHPPRTIKIPDTAAEHQQLLELTTSWPVDSMQRPASLFDKQCRVSASSKLQSQKSINRRKTLAPPGQFPELAVNDPRIPALLYCANTASGKSIASGKQGRWTVLLPWKCVQPVWYSVMYYPLSTGGQPRFGGIMEKRQLCFETGTPSFPEDFPGTQAGFQWELQERNKRHAEWKRRPKSKRVNWDVVDLGGGRKGEIGEGWACDWQKLVDGLKPQSHEATTMMPSGHEVPSANGFAKDTDDTSHSDSDPTTPWKSQATHCSSAEAHKFMSSTVATADTGNALASVRITLLNRGVPQACARIYRLPNASTGNLRQRWLALHPSNRPEASHRGPKNSLPRPAKKAPAELVQQLLVQSLLTTPKVGDSHYPVCPDEDDLIGFVTTGNFNLGEGQGTGVGAILLKKVMGDGAESRLCIVRNAGTGVGRLAQWDLV